MNTPKILIGHTTFDWHFAKGKYACNCATLDDMNPLDMVICGLLYHSDNTMKRDEIARLMGLNVIDDPEHNFYRDRSEYAIYKSSLESLKNYNLVTYDEYDVKLTKEGKEAVEKRKKKNRKTRDVELLVDEFNCITSPSNLKEMERTPITTMPYQPETDPEWNVLIQKHREILGIQHKDLVDKEKGNEVLTMNLVNMDYFVTHIECDIYHDLSSGESVVKTVNNIKVLDRLLNDNEEFRTQILNSFFSDKEESVIYKSNLQKEIEESICNQEKKGKDTSVISTPENVVDDIANASKNIIFFSIKEIDEITRKNIEDFASNNKTIACVDYKNGDFEDDLKTIGSVCYHRVKELRTTDICIYGNMYLMPITYVVGYGDKDYAIQMYYHKCDKDKYNFDALFLPYKEHILQSFNDIFEEFTQCKELNASILRNIMSICNDVRRICQKDLTESITRCWNDKIHEQVNEIEVDINARKSREICRIRLSRLKEQIEGTFVDEDNLMHIEEVKKRLDEDGRLKIKKQTPYIFDTNVFMEMPDIFNKLAPSQDMLIMPRAVQQELDGLKNDNEKGEVANKALIQYRRYEETYRHMIIKAEEANLSLLPSGFDRNKKDNHILVTAIEHAKNEKYDKLIVVTNDKEFSATIHDLLSEEKIDQKIEVINLDDFLLRKDQ